MTKILTRALPGAVALAAALGVAAAAQTAETPGAADAIIDEVLENGPTDREGVKQPETGRAKPIENWFGCKPDPAQGSEVCEAKGPSEDDATLRR